MYICLRDKSGEFENQYNRVYFVVMHELAHIITKSVGHTEEYWDNYRLILKTAIDNGLYEYKNYYEEPVEFCNKEINSTPYVKGGELNNDESWNIIMFIFILLIGYFIYKKFLNIQPIQEIMKNLFQLINLKKYIHLLCCLIYVKIMNVDHIIYGVIEYLKCLMVIIMDNLYYL